MQRHKFARAFKFTSFLTVMLFTVLLTGTLYAAPKVGPLTPEISIIGETKNDEIGSGGVYSLPSGNIVIVSPNWGVRRGAVTCLTPSEYKAGGITVNATNSLIGAAASNDNQIGFGGVVVLSNGNYIVMSPGWNNHTGAVTWVNGTTCIPYGGSSRNAVVSAENSLTGLTRFDSTGYPEDIVVTPLTNGNYVVNFKSWDNGTITNVGAVTWADGSTGLAGTVNESNSLIGSSTDDLIGNGGITALNNGNYVVGSYFWDNGAVINAGAATWADGTTGIVGQITSTNSLIGSSKDDMVGYGALNAGTPRRGITALINGNYLVASYAWDNGGIINAGAVTWGNGNTGIVGTIDETNSLVGSSTNDMVGHLHQVTALTNGNYVVGTPSWDNGSIIDVGAATWGNGETGSVGTINATNSLIGTGKEDQVAFGCITALTNGNYVVSSPSWHSNGLGAATWGNGTSGIVGTISAANSLVGSKHNDLVSYTNRLDCSAVTALTNGNYVVASPSWNTGYAYGDDVGAVTWGNGVTGTIGIVSSANSLIGSSEDDQIGLDGVTPLTNGNYVVNSSRWNNGAISHVGAVTWGNGNGGTIGVANGSNSLIGSRSSDESVGAFGITALPNGHYVVGSDIWLGVNNYANALTWGNGEGGTVGTVDATNSVVGSANGYVSHKRPTVLTNGNYLVAGSFTLTINAVMLANGMGGTIGTLDPLKSLTISQEREYLDPGSITALPDGSFIVNSPNWAYTSSVSYVGAVTWSDGTFSEPNNNPVLTEIGNQPIDENETLAFDAEATDSDHPAQTLTFSITGAPEDASFNTTTGEFAWTTDEADGEQTFNVIVTVTDNGQPALGDSETFTITVNEVNDAPVLAEIGDQTLTEGESLTVDAEATDADEPAQTLTFSITGAPEDATFDTATGEFSWTADAADGGQVFNVTVSVTDNGEPAESDSEDFTITVNPVVVEETNYLPNASFENPGTTNKTAAGWNGIGLTTNDKRVCDTETKTYAHDGECAFRFQFNGATAPARTLQRNLNVANFAKNNVVQLRGMVKANNLTAGARLIVKVVYNNGKTESANVNLTAGSYEYSPFATQITIKRPAKKITVQIKAGSAKGVYFVDDMAVVKVAAPLTIDDGAGNSGLRGLR